MSTAIMEKPAGWLVADGLECGEQGLYHLPKDHAWHSGPTYFCNDYFEWHYFTFLGKDQKTGHDISLFWCAMSQGFSTQLNRPVMPLFFAWHDKVTGEFIHTTIVPFGKFQSTGSGELAASGSNTLSTIPMGKGLRSATNTPGNSGTSNHLLRKRARLMANPTSWTSLPRSRLPGTFRAHIGG